MTQGKAWFFNLITTFTWSRNEKADKTEMALTQHMLGRPRVRGFSIPALKSQDGFVTCPGAGACARTCYARQGYMVMRPAREAHHHNLKQVRRYLEEGTLVTKLLHDLARIRTTHVRIHDGGDFFSKIYYQAWVQVAKLLPHTVFWTYTKSFSFLEWETHPPNLYLVQSLMSNADEDVDLSRPHARWFPDLVSLEAAGYTNTTSETGDYPVICGAVKIGLIHHGNKLLDRKSLVALQDQPTSTMSTKKNQLILSHKEALAQILEKHGEDLTGEKLLNLVKKRGPKHPLYSLFEWNDDKAAHQYRLIQAKWLLRQSRFEFRPVGTLEPVEIERTTRVPHRRLNTPPKSRSAALSPRKQCKQDFIQWCQKWEKVLGADAVQEIISTTPVLVDVPDEHVREPPSRKPHHRTW